ncbi:MAG TPA: hypothetical protein VF103_18725 [Polyangiaceae bacterium]
MTLTRTPLGGRYSLERPLLSSRDQQWMAIEIASGKLVVLSILEPGRLSTLLPARGVTHRHLTTIVDVMRDIAPGAFPDRVKLPAGAGVCVAEHVPGRSLRSALDGGALQPAKAVAWTLRLADAVQVLHAAGAVHGAISPRSVLATPEGRAIAPVLTQLIAPPIGPFCPPERLRGGPESQTDDVWALYGVLYAALTGKAPFWAPTREALVRAMNSRPTPLSSFGVEEPALQEIIARGLNGERRGRSLELLELVSALDGWERDPKMLPPPAPPPRPAQRGLGDIVSGAAFTSAREDGVIVDDAALADDQGRPADVPEDEAETMVAKLSAQVQANLAAKAAAAGLTAAAPSAPKAAAGPADAAQAPVRAQAPVVPKRPSFNPFAKRKSVLPWVIVGVVVAGGVGYLALAPKSKPAEKPEAAAQDQPPAPPRAAPKPTVARSPEVVRDECIAAHFPANSFAPQTDFAFVCADGNFRETAARLHMLAVELEPDAGAGAAAADAGLAVDVVRAVGGHDLDAGPLATRLGWYELPATAIIRRACCPAAGPVTLHETPGPCQQLQTVVQQMADDSAKSVDLAPRARNFEKAVGCLYAAHIRHGYDYDRPPTPANRALFQQFLGRAAISSTRR